MLTGLCALTVNNKGEITTLWARDMDSDDLDDCINGAGVISQALLGRWRFPCTTSVATRMLMAL